MASGSTPTATDAMTRENVLLPIMVRSRPFADRVHPAPMPPTLTTPGTPGFVSVDTLNAEQQRNFANWYTYYRSPELILKRAMSEVVETTTSYVGMSTLNSRNAGMNRQPIELMNVGIPVSDMTVQTNKEAVLNNLFSIFPAGTTPLRSALFGVGRYFDQSNSNDSARLGFDAPSPILSQAAGGECQQNFAVLMTDGQWNGGLGGVGNADGDDNSDFDGGPHADTYSNTLADVAMRFYESDLSSTLDNKVRPSDYQDPVTGIVYQDENQAQHLNTYTISFGVSGSGLTTPGDHDASTSAPPWTEPRNGRITTIDDVQHAAFNGRGLYLDARRPQELIDALLDALSAAEQRANASGTAIGINGATVRTTSRIFQASFVTVDWSGELEAFSLNADGTVNQRVWTATNNFPAVDDPDDRDIFTYVLNASGSGKTGIAFDDNPGNSMLNTEIGTLTVGTKLYTAADLIHYISGDQANEGLGSNLLRMRQGILGDIVSSSPVAASNQDFGYSILPGTAGGSNYPGFLATKETTFTDGDGKPRAAVYVGANDGMLHAFHDSQSASTNGDELFAYIPSTLLPRLKNLAEPTYTHEFFVNGNHTVGDVCMPNVISGGCSWKTILVGTLGEGGRTVYALDVTDPFNFSASDILWEYNFNDARDNTDNSNQMGHIKGAPQIARLNNGQWGVIFGNGYNSDNHEAQLFILNAENGEEIAVFNTRQGSITNPNGLATPLIVDENNDRIADTVYAGRFVGKFI